LARDLKQGGNLGDLEALSAQRAGEAAAVAPEGGPEVCEELRRRRERRLGRIGGDEVTPRHAGTPPAGYLDELVIDRRQLGGALCSRSFEVLQRVKCLVAAAVVGHVALDT
jgi:hypothetical protein